MIFSIFRNFIFNPNANFFNQKNVVGSLLISMNGYNQNIENWVK